MHPVQSHQTACLLLEPCMPSVHAGEGISAEEVLEFETRVSGVLAVRRTADGMYHLSAGTADPTDALPAHAQPGSPLLKVRGALQPWRGPSITGGCSLLQLRMRA